MSPLFGHLVGGVILLLMSVFIGIWFWAWRPRHKPVFDALAEIPMRDADADDETETGGGGGPRATGP